MYKTCSVNKWITTGERLVNFVKSFLCSWSYIHSKILPCLFTIKKTLILIDGLWGHMLTGFSLRLQRTVVAYNELFVKLHFAFFLKPQLTNLNDMNNSFIKSRNFQLIWASKSVWLTHISFHKCEKIWTFHDRVFYCDKFQLESTIICKYFRVLYYIYASNR